jgi:hypothetical protein
LWPTRSVHGDGVIIGVDPHKASATIEVRYELEVLRATGGSP